MRIQRLLIPASLALGCSDNGVKAINAEPVAEITSHSDGQTVLEGYVESFRGLVSDPDHTATDLTVTWYAGSTVACEASAPDSDGLSTCDIEMSLDTPEVVLEVQDPKDAAGSDRIELEVEATEPPVVEITAPIEDGKYYSDQLRALEGEASDAEDTVEDLTIDWESSLDGPLDASTVPTSSGLFSSYASLSEGEHALTVTATDTTGKTGSDSVVITVGPPNSAPTCAITAPETNSANEEGTLVTFDGWVDDVDVPLDWLSIEWESDKDGSLGASTPNSDGTVSFPYADLSVNTHVVSLTVTDEVGASCTDSVIYSVGTPPTLDVASPTSGDVVNSGDLVTFQATVSDGEDSPTDLALSWVSDLDGEFSTQGSDSTGEVLFTSDSLSVGLHTLTVTVTDTDDLYAQQLLTLQINTAPTAPEIELNPDPATTTDDLAVSILADSTDDDGDPITYTFDWTVNGVPTTVSTSANLASADTTKGELWAVTVTPNDGYTDGPSGTDSVTIDNTAPILADVSLTPDPAAESDTLSCTPGTTTDDDGDTVTLAINWSVSGVDPGITDDELTGDHFNKGDAVFCTVTPSDDEVAGDAVDSNTVTIENTLPTIDSVSIAPDPAVATDTLICSYEGFSDDDGDADASTLEWAVNGTVVGTDPELSGAFVGGDSVTCTVTPSDGTDTGTPISASLTIDNSPPILDGVTLGPDPAYEGDTLTCTAGSTTDDDGESVTLIYAWNVDGVDPGVSTSTLDSSSFDRDQTVRCTVTPQDGSEDGEPVTSNEIVISNTVPEVTDVVIEPTSATVADELTCSYTFTDVDGDTDDSDIAWTINGIDAGSGASLSSGYTGGDVIVCTVTPNDGTDSGSALSDTLTIGNTPPELADVVVSPDPAFEGDTLTCTPGTTTDVDGTTSFTYLYSWSVDGSDPGVTDATLESTDFDRDQVVYCTVVPNDGSDSGSPVDSNAITIGNTAPSIDSVAITPDPATTSDPLTCSYSGWFDLDDDADTDTAITWAINGTDASTGDTLSTGYVGGDTVTCTVTPDDGSDAGTALTTSLVITNTPPELTSVSLTPTAAVEGDTLTCAPDTATDADGETVAYAYAWSVDGSDPGITTDTLGSADFSRDQSVFCTVTPSDGTESGDPVDSNTVVIGNTAPSIDSVSIAPDPAQAADTLTCSYSGFADADGDADESTWLWTVDGTDAGSDTTLAGAFSGGSVVVCTVTPNDGTDTGTPLSATLTIDNTAPSIDTVSISPDPATVSNALTCSHSGWSDDDGDADASTYAWSINGSDAGTGTTLSTGYTGGDTVTCTVTPDDGTDTGTPISASLVITNTPPELSSVALTPTSATEVDTLTCTPDAATDADGDTVTYSYRWSVDGSDPGVSTDTLDGSYFDRDQSVFCTVTPSDADESGDAVDSNTVTITNTPPSIDSVSIAPSEAIASDTLTCSYSGYDDADDDSDASTIAWTVDGAEVGTDAELSGAFNAGDDVTCTVTPNDGSATGTAISDTITIHTPPEISSVSLTPTAPAESDTLTCAAATATDVDGDTVTTTIEWSVDGTDPGVSTDTLTGAYFDRDQAVFCTVTPTDTYESGTPVDSNTVTVINTPPEIGSVTISPSSAAATDTLTCSYTGFNDDDGDSDASTLAWTVDGTEVGTDAALSGAFVGGDIVTCTVTPNDGTDTGTALSDSITIDNTPPVLSDVTLGPAPAYEADTLTCTPGSIFDEDGTSSFTYTYSWTVSGSDPGVSTATLTGDYFDRGDTISCTATPNDGSDDGDSVTSNEVEILNSPPSVTDLYIDPNPAYAEDVLLCEWTFIDDDGTEDDRSDVEWSVNGVSTGDALTLAGEFVFGDEVTCTVTPNDGSDTGTAQDVSITISNTAPVLHDVTIDPDSAYELDTLTCVAGYTSDADGTESFYYSYAWYVNGVDIAVTDDFIDGSYFDRGDEVMCISWPNDGDDEGDPVASDILTISNTPPVLDFVTIVPTEPTVDDVLICNYGGYYDDDGDPESGTTINWAVNGTDLGSGPTFSTTVDPGDTVTCTVYPSDGDHIGEPVSDEVVVVNQLPEIASLSLSPVTVYTDDVLTASASGTDPEGEPVTLSYVWYIDGVQSSETGSTLDGGTHFDKGQEVYVVVIPNDGIDDGNPETSSTVTIANTLPVASTPTLAPDPAYEADTLTCTPGTSSDADGDSVSLSYGWLVDGVPMAVTDDELDGTYFDRGQTVFCGVTPFDGEDSGTIETSVAIEISNTAPQISSVSISPASPNVGESLTCSYTGFSDDDDDSDASTYSWTIDGSEVGTSATLSSGYTSGDEVTCTVTPSDGDDAGTALSDSVTVVNAPPTITAVTLSPSTVYTDDTLIASVTTDDDDGDTVSLSYAWYVDGILIGATTSSISGETYFDKDDEVYVVVTPNDGTEDGDSDTSETVTVSNTAPSAPTVSIEPDEPIAGENDIICTIDTDASDDDGDSISYTITWDVDGTAYEDATTTHETGDTVASGDLAGDEEWTCTVTPNDGDEDGSSAEASTTVVDCFAGWDASVIAIGDAADYTITGASSSDNAGWTVASAGDVDGDGLSDLLIGAPGQSDGGTSAGAAYLVFASSLSSTDSFDLSEADHVFLGENSSDQAGLSVATAGDIDGDGLDDILIGAPYETAGGTEAGAAYLILASSLDSTEEINLGNSDYKFIGETDGDRAGISVSTAEDVNGDGLDDILIGALFQDSGGTDSGGAYLVLGSSLTDTREFHLEDSDYRFIGDDPGDRAGNSVSNLGDIDNDGLSDIIIGAYEAGITDSLTGVTYIVLGSSLGTSTDIDLSNADYQIEGELSGDQSGYSVAGAGDVDGDGLDDILIGAWTEDSGGSNSGSAYLVLASSLGSSSTFNLTNADYQFIGESEGDYAGKALSNAGDIDGDGLNDLIFGVHLESTAAAQAGATYLVLSSSLGSSAEIDLSTSDYKFTGDSESDYFGTAVSNAGDINGDGLSDLWVGAYLGRSASDLLDAGAGYLLLSPTTCNTPPRGTSVSIDPTDPIENVDDLICEIDVDAYDAEGDALTYSIEWEVDGVAYSDATTTVETGDTVPADEIFVDEEWTCIVTPNDGEEDGAPTETTVIIDSCDSGSVDLNTGGYLLASDWDDYLASSYSDMTVELYLYITSDSVSDDGYVLQSAISATSSQAWLFAATLYGQGMPLNEWVHVAKVWDSTANEIRTYLDGALVATNSHSDASINAHGLKIGHHDSGHYCTDCQVQGLRLSDSVRYDADFSPSINYEVDTDTLLLFPLTTYSTDGAYDAGPYGISITTSSAVSTGSDGDYCY